jgi:hypothetical protein
MRRRSYGHANSLQGLPIAVLSLFNSLARLAVSFFCVLDRSLELERPSTGSRTRSGADADGHAPLKSRLMRTKVAQTWSLVKNFHTWRWTFVDGRGRDASGERCMAGVARAAPNGRMSNVAAAPAQCERRRRRSRARRFGRGNSELDFEEQGVLLQEQGCFSQEQGL